MGECQVCSEAPQARGRPQHVRYPAPYLPRHLWPPGYCPRKGQTAGSVSDLPGHLPGVNPDRAFPLGIDLTEAYLERRCGWGVSPHCQGIEVGGLWQREGGSK